MPRQDAASRAQFPAPRLANIVCVDSLRLPVTKRYFLLATVLVLLPWGARAELYSFVNEDGDYVISKDRPSAGEYVVLTDDGEFVERIQSPALDVPISHWRPWYLPREPNPFISTEPKPPPEGSVVIEEVEESDRE